MKKITAMLLLICMLFGISKISFADSTGTFYKEYGIWFDTKTGTITGFQDGITTLEIPKRIGRKEVLAIGEKAFYECTTLTKAVIPNSVTQIGTHAFAGCSSLEKIVFSSSLKEIGKEAFIQCTSLKEVLLPSSLETIENSAFLSCSSLTKVKLPENISFIGEGAFSYCENLKEISVPEENTFFCEENGVLFDKEKTTLIQYPAGLTSDSYEVPQSVTTIKTGAFAYNDHLNFVLLQDGLTSIGEFAFFECDGLETITVPDTVLTIGEEAFGWCDNLKEAVLPEGLDRIEYGLFWYAKNLEQIKIPDSVNEICNYAFARCESLASVELSENLASLGEESFAYCSNLTKIDMPKQVTMIGKKAFLNNTSLQYVIVRNGSAYFEEKVFDGCKNLQFFSPADSAVQAYVLGNGDEWEKIITVTYLGHEISFDQPPVSRSSRTLVPVRAVFEAMGATVEWIGEDNTVAVSRNGTLIFLTMDSQTMWINHNAVQLDVAPIQKNGRILVPVRAIAEGLNCDIYWDETTQTVSIWEKE